MIEIIDLKDVTSIVLNSEIIEGKKNDDRIEFKTFLSPKIIDSNFHELEGMINEMQKTIQNQSLTIQKLEHKINILEAINKNA